MKPLPFVLALFTAGACSSTTGTPDPGDAGTTAVTAEFWGLKDDLCLHYVDGDGNERYTIDVEADDRAVPGISTFHLAYLLQGLEVKSDWVEVKGETLLLHRRSIQPRSTSATLWSYDPPATYLDKSLEPGDARTSHPTGHRSGGALPAGNENLVLTTNEAEPETFEVMGKQVEARKFVLTTEFADGTSTSDRVWFVPETGIVKIDPDGSDVEEVTLKSIEPLIAGAPCLVQ